MSSRREEAEALKQRALEFYEEAKTALDAKRYNLACFFAEQAAQLYLKQALLKIVGDYSKIHHVRELLSELIRSKQSDKLKSFAEEYNAHLSSLEDAYIMSRYSTKKYSKTDAEESIKVVEKLFQLVDEVLES